MVAQGTFGSTLGTENYPKAYKIFDLAQVFCTSISEGLLARIVDETGSELDVRNSVWTAPARADRIFAVLRKTCPGATFLNDFDVVLAAKSSYLGHFGCTVALFFAAGFVVVVSTIGTIKTQPKTTSSPRSKSI